LKSNNSAAYPLSSSSSDEQADSTLSNTLSSKNLSLKDNSSISQTPSTSTSTNHKQSLFYSNKNSSNPKALLNEFDTNQLSSTISCAPVIQFIELQSSSVLPNTYPISQKQSTKQHIPVNHNSSLKPPSLLSNIVNLDTKYLIEVNSLTTAYGTFI
jgi:hypothetical protein